MSKEKEKGRIGIEEKIISFVHDEQPVYIGEIFKGLRISQTKGMNCVISLINQGKLNYGSNNQVLI